MGGQKKAPADLETERFRAHVLQHLNAIYLTVNLLAENAGLGSQLAALTEQLRGPTDKLKAAIDANQPKV